MVKDAIADITLQQVLTRPEDFDVIATLNLNGDYISAVSYTHLDVYKRQALEGSLTRNSARSNWVALLILKSHKDTSATICYAKNLRDLRAAI